MCVFKFKIKAKVIKGTYENLECLTVGLKVVDELLNPITIVPVFFNDNEKMHFMENISVYADLMTLYWLWMNQSLPLSPNYVNFGIHSFVDKHYKEYSNVFTKDNSVITNHWLFKEFKKIIVLPFWQASRLRCVMLLFSPVWVVLELLVKNQQ